MNGRELSGPPEATTARRPAEERDRKSPPRRSAPGPPTAVLAPERHMKSSLKLPQPGQSVDNGTQSATHSSRFPTMSKAPRAEMHSLREPVGVAASESLLQSVVRL